MSCEIEWSQKAAKEFGKIDNRYKKGILDKIDQLVQFPDVCLDIKHLRKSEYRFRHGEYRVLFEWIDGVPKIIKIQAVKRRNNRTYS